MAKAKATPAPKIDGIITVTTKTLIKTLRALLKDPYLVPCVLGPAGIGKSSIFQQIAQQDFSGKMLDIRLGQMQEEDLIGIPSLDNGRTIYNLPFFWPTEGKGIVFFDEVNRAKKGMLQCLFQLVLDRQYFNYKLPDDYRLVFAGNWSPQELMYQVEEMDPALRSRFVILYYVGPTYEEWKEWAVKNNIVDAVVAFLGVHNNFLVTEPKDDKPSPNPRTWEKASRIINVTDDREIRRAAFAGCLGMEATSLLLQFIDQGGWEALPDPSNLKDALKIVSKWVKAKDKNGHITSFIQSICDFVKGGGEYEPEQFIQFVKGVPKEFAHPLLQGLFDNPDTTEFIKEMMETDQELLREYLQAA